MVTTIPPDQEVTSTEKSTEHKSRNLRLWSRSMSINSYSAQFFFTATQKPKFTHCWWPTQTTLPVSKYASSHFLLKRTQQKSICWSWASAHGRCDLVIIQHTHDPMLQRGNTYTSFFILINRWALHGGRNKEVSPDDGRMKLFCVSCKPTGSVPN